MIAAIAALLACQLAGEVLVRALGLPVPGPVAGMGILFLVLVWRGRRANGAEAIPPAVGDVADALLRNLSLLFIPAAAGVVQYLGLLGTYAWQLALAIVVSTLAAMIVTVLTFRLVARLHAFRRKGLAGDVEAALDPERHP